MENDLRNRFPKNSAYNVYDQIYNVNPPPDNLLAQSSFSQPTGVKESVEVGTKVASTGTMWATIGVVGVVTAFTAVSAVIGYSYWNTTLNPFFSSTLTTILTNIALLFTNFTTVYNLAVSLNYTVGNLTATNFTINSDAYFTNFNGSVPLFNTSASNVGVALNYLATNDNFMRNQINQILATPPSTPNAYSVPFNGSSPLFNTSSSEVGSALNYLATNDNFMRNQINQILATPPSTPNAYNVPFNGSNPLFNTSATEVGSALNYLATNDNFMRNQINNVNGDLNDLSTTVYNNNAKVTANVVQEISVRPVAEGGNDATCAPAGGTPCATMTKAYSFIPNFVDDFNVWKINVRGYVIESGGLALKCNTIIQGDDNTYIQAAGFSYDSNSFGATAACNILVRNAAFVPTAASLMDASNYTGQTFFLGKFENFSTQGSYSQPWTIKHGSNFAQIIFNDIGSAYGSISSLSIINAHVVTLGYAEFAAQLNVKFDAKDGYLNLNGLRIPTGGFFVNNTNGHTLTFEGAGWTNPNSNYVLINTDAGASTYTRGAAAFQGILNYNGTYGPFFVGAGSVFTTLTEGSIGLGHNQLVLSNYNGITYANVAEIIESFAARIETLENIQTPNTYIGGFVTSSTAIIGGNSCGFDVNLNVGSAYIRGQSVFAKGGSADLFYNGSVNAGFLFSFSANLAISYTGSGATAAVIGGTLVATGSGYTSDVFLTVPLQTAGSNVVSTKIEWSDLAFFNVNDDITMFFNINGVGVSTTFTACTISLSGNVPYIRFQQFDP